MPYQFGLTYLGGGGGTSEKRCYTDTRARWCHHASTLHPSVFVHFQLFHPTNMKNISDRISSKVSPNLSSHEKWQIIHATRYLTYAVQALELDLIHQQIHFGQGTTSSQKCYAPIMHLPPSYLYAPRLLLNGDKVLHLCSALVQQFHAVTPL